MNTVRTLPIRIGPIEGEAIDSWLEAIAHRTHTAFGDLLAAVALSPYNGMGTTAWIVSLNPDEAATISTATGITPDVLETMTLQHYSGRAVRIQSGARMISRAFPWGRGRGSRFCPACLAETDGRWQLRWRLGWTFACTIHNCLLADACPDCGAAQRRRTHIGDIVPQPGRCSHRAPDAVGRTPPRCSADLTTAAVASFDADHPVMHAQRVVNTVVDSETPTFGVYQTLPQPRLNVLSDIRAVAGRVLAFATPQDLEAIVPQDLNRFYRCATEPSDSRSGPAPTDTKPGLAAPARAVTAAVGVVAALNALDRLDVASAGDALRWLVSSSRERGSEVNATNVAWGKNTSPVLTAVQLAALGPLLNPSDQLRCRIGTPVPARPVPGAERTATLARRLPAMLWPTWSLQLAIPNCHQWQLRPALSNILLLVNSRLNLDEAAGVIDSPIEGHAVSRVLQLLERQDQWPSIRAALIRMADYLAHNDIPIDYQRRRRTDYSMLLPDKVWAQISRDTATPGPRPARARVARCFLFERLSGRPASASPWALDDSAFRTKTADFPRHLTPELAKALNARAYEFLADQGIDDEPVTWHPPKGVLDGLNLPGPDPTAVLIAQLHGVMAVDGIKLGTAAQRLNTSLDTVRYLLETHPAPRADSDEGATLSIPYNRAYLTAKQTLSRTRLVDLYERQRMSLKDIAVTVGVSRQIIARLARDYDVPLREPGLQARTTIDRDWLYDQYVNRRRALPDIAKEAGMSTANMARWAKTHAIPMRGRGGGSHSSNLAAESFAAEAPELIRPALAGIGGWERLDRFAAATRYPTLTVAAAKLGVGQTALVSQINRIERELGARLLNRAERGRPMELTDAGARVIATIRAWQRVRGT
ncbi:TniQ family protein [Mycobacteroides abscessus]|uniref:TniQ family protein n=1 Tax=Mycobacteroides abscessus TaxID=36809 RepID=UPI000928A5A8|nr:TniQ family protein [Mycobacteroides abscessus]SII54569.1 regulatory helix-turn-helix protein, lysR family [Mycobacteroides abscessus subsp. abscessus]